MKRGVFFVLMCTVLFAGCAASPVHYYTLASSEPFDNAGRTRAELALDILPISVPPSLDQAYLAIRRGRNEVVFADDERWASPLGNEIKAALSARLRSRLSVEDVSGRSVSSARLSAMLDVEIRQLDVWPGTRVQLTARWRARLSNRRDRALNCVTQLQEPVGASDYVSLVQAQRAVIVRLADIIGAKVMELEISAPTDPSCSTAA